MNSGKRVYSGKKAERTGSSSSKRLKISGRRPSNRYELEKPNVESPSTSAKKLSAPNPDEFEIQEGFGYRILDFLTVFTAISQAVVCKKCKSDIKFTECGMRGLGFKIVITCVECDQIFIPSSPFIEKGYDINRRIILAMRLLGVLNDIMKFCAFMDLPRPIFQSFYDRVVQKISVEAEKVCQQSMKTAAQKEKVTSIEKGLSNGITVSGDGSWRKHGFSSLFGFVSLIGWHTGQLVDVLIKFKYCKACEYWEKKKTPKSTKNGPHLMKTNAKQTTSAQRERWKWMQLLKYSSALNPCTI
ncbi:uncharacterized protein LOC116845720 [Odontomachus brunneus]|uniref:uncharacterized protein LOC116845720 n=1 Tax=Odontomachus brunneus TaxID=486640 RepID=UPI0013F1806E|nr:uncharacterized protein LOC116845720 [Odontomachus brunneus]